MNKKIMKMIFNIFINNKLKIKFNKLKIIKKK